MKNNQNENRQRDVETLRVLGIFFSVMGLLVLIATYEAIGNTAAVVVSVCSGLVLLTVGTGAMLVSRRMSRQPKT